MPTLTRIPQTSQPARIDGPGSPRPPAALVAAAALALVVVLGGSQAMTASALPGRASPADAATARSGGGWAASVVLAASGRWLPRTAALGTELRPGAAVAGSSAPIAPPRASPAVVAGHAEKAPLAIAPSPERPRAPRTGNSYYMKTTRRGVAHAMGCAYARGANRADLPHDSVVVLAFGSPRHAWAKYGTSLFGHGFASTWQIGRAVEAYADGFWDCSSPRVAPALRIAVGTSNYGRQVSWGHGRAWAEMVNSVNDTIARRGHAGRIDAVGANDIELSWNGPGVSKAWVAGYDSANRWPYYDYGDAAGCPPYGHCAGAWTLEDVWWVAWGARPAIPLPEIYTGSGSSARQWYRLSLYSHQQHGSPMVFAGVMSQRQACRQVRDSCRGMDNSPSRAYWQLTNLLNADHRTAQQLRWSTDIRWRP